MHLLFAILACGIASVGNSYVPSIRPLAFERTGARLRASTSSTVDQDATTAAARVNPDMFKQGAYWVWQYFDQSGNVVSSQRLSVVEAKGARILVESSVSEVGPSGNSGYEPKQRWDIDLEDALEAHDDPDDEPHWDYRGLLEPSSEEGGQQGWIGVRNRDLVFPFEEKFNFLVCLGGGKDPNYSLAVETRETGALGAVDLFQTKRKDVDTWYKGPGDTSGMWCTHREWQDTKSWHLLWPKADCPENLVGVTILKEFGPRSKYSRLELAEW
eukprot:CAMPEP_0172620100 /NCGR_PEP_ID=MMETSP1068-20121228/100190_1 /TAXON_ID=35684 /ORGANISM="Pseudopedinella elastica, Strain CCMP716" /LENGTH=270 /DNA_ID=CAMNT_0013427203 /DNA_START=26 /DNA_END=835 /DNA_ORIENTATION=-